MGFGIDNDDFNLLRYANAKEGDNNLGLIINNLEGKQEKFYYIKRSVHCV